MDLLPNELRQEILQYLAVEDVKNFRRVSKDWSILGEDFLIKPVFHTLPHRDDFKRLLDLSRHPIFEAYVEKVVFNCQLSHFHNWKYDMLTQKLVAEMNEYQARHNLYYLNYTRDTETRQQVLSEALKEWKTLDNYKKSFADNYCSSAILKESFENYTGLKSLEIRMTECPFENKLLEKLWDVPVSRHLSRCFLVNCN